MLTKTLGDVQLGREFQAYVIVVDILNDTISRHCDYRVKGWALCKCHSGHVFQVMHVDSLYSLSHHVCFNENIAKKFLVKFPCLFL